MPADPDDLSARHDEYLMSDFVELQRRFVGGRYDCTTDSFKGMDEKHRAEIMGWLGLRTAESEQPAAEVEV